MNDERLTELLVVPAPRWSMRVGEPALSTIYADHEYRMLAVIAAARSGDRILIKLALENYDAKGTGPEETTMSAVRTRAGEP